MYHAHLPSSVRVCVGPGGLGLPAAGILLLPLVHEVRRPLWRVENRERTATGRIHWSGRRVNIRQGQRVGGPRGLGLGEGETREEQPEEVERVVGGFNIGRLGTL